MTSKLWSEGDRDSSTSIDDERDIRSIQGEKIIIYPEQSADDECEYEKREKAIGHKQGNKRLKFANIEKTV